MTQFEIEPASEHGVGFGPNGTGKRSLVTGYFVVRITNSYRKRVRAFTGKNAETDAKNWAGVLTSREG